MTEVQHHPRGGKGGDPPFARLALGRFIEAAVALDAAWHEVLDCPTYPRYLPSFDELVRDLQDWEDEVEDRPYTEPPKREPLVLADSAMMRTWLTELRAQIADALAAGEDATRLPSRRRLGRKTARRTLQEASRAVEQLLKGSRSWRLASHAGLTGVGAVGPPIRTRGGQPSAPSCR